jgi:hypothetical protein
MRRGRPTAPHTLDRTSHPLPPRPAPAPQLRLSGAQLEEKRQAESDIKEIEEVLALEAEGSAKHAELTSELKDRQKKLDELMETFAKVTLETALSGGAPRVSQIRQQQQLTQQQSGDMGYGAAPSSFPPRSSFGGRCGAGAVVQAERLAHPLCWPARFLSLCWAACGA